ncbi:hypothetical protein TURU_099602 [Turdus rufiventris]|nr:hypothetical protein TURU_099602 [Turdus rufiventris]
MQAQGRASDSMRGHSLQLSPREIQVGRQEEFLHGKGCYCYDDDDDDDDDDYYYTLEKCVSYRFYYD